MTFLNRLVPFAAFVVMVSSADVVVAAPAPCTSDEDVVFACSTGKARVVAVCASRADKGDLQYRFGTPRTTELMLSTAPDSPSRATVSGDVLTFSGGGGAYLRFKRRSTDYVVYTAVGVPWGEQSGVAAFRDGKRLRDAKCVGKVRSAIGPDFFKRAGIAHDDAGFELPD